MFSDQVMISKRKFCNVPIATQNFDQKLQQTIDLTKLSTCATLHALCLNKYCFFTFHA